jgi:hypothetical protein
MAKCQTHGAAASAGTCRSCLREFCGDCLVYSYGRAKAPYCIRCALVAAGTAVPDDLEVSAATETISA